MKFPRTTPEEDEKSFIRGMEIFYYLKNHFSDNSDEHFNLILNSLTCALVKLGCLNVSSGLEEEFGDLIKKILVENLKKNRQHT